MATLESIEITLEGITHTLGLFGKKFEEIDQRFERIDQRFEQMDLRLEKMDQRFDSLEVKFDEKIDDLAAMTARGFLEINERLGVIEENYVTKDDLAFAEARLDRSFSKQIDSLTETQDDHARRIKDVEKVVFAT